MPNPALVGRATRGARLPAREDTEFAARRRRAGRSRYSAWRNLQLLETDRAGEPATRICHRPDAAAGLPGTRHRRRPLPTLERAVRIRAAGRLRDCRAACAF